jgi:hypothetical protein
MGWFEGLLSGYVDRHHELVDQQAVLEQEARQREAGIYKMLLDSPDDEAYHLGATGLLSMSQPARRAGGLRGWMGEMQKNPAYGAIQRYMETPQWRASRAALRPTAIEGQLTEPPTTAAMPTSVPVQGQPMQQPEPKPGAQPTAQTPPGAGAGWPFMQGGRPPWEFLPPPPPDTTETRFRNPPPLPPTGSIGSAGADASVMEMQRRGEEPVPRFQSSTSAVAQAPPTAGPVPELPPRSLAPPVPPQLAQAQQPTGEWHRPHVFPTTQDAAGFQSGGALTGQWNAYYRMHIAEGLDDQAARQAATDDVTMMHMRGGSGATANQPMEFEITQPDGTVARVLGWADKRAQRYVDVNGMPFPANTNFTKAVPYSAVTGDVYYREALNNLNIHPGQVRGNPQVAQQVQLEANRIAQERAGGLVTARGTAAAGNPLSGAQRVSTMGEMQSKFNTFMAPVRVMEQYLRQMVATYPRLKGTPPDMVAWEPFRTSFVRVTEAGSVVMPSEFTRSGSIGSLAQRLVGQVDQWLQGGGTLTPEQIDGMMRTAAHIWDAVATYDAQFRSQVEEQLKDPAMQNIRPEQIYGGPSVERYNPWTAFQIPQSGGPPIRQPGTARPNPNQPPAANPANQPVNPGGWYLDQNGQWRKSGG